jgi:hypothetical protein
MLHLQPRELTAQLMLLALQHPVTLVPFFLCPCAITNRFLLLAHDVAYDLNRSTIATANDSPRQIGT